MMERREAQRASQRSGGKDQGGEDGEREKGKTITKTFIPAIDVYIPTAVKQVKSSGCFVCW